MALVHNAKTEVSKGDRIIMGDFNHGHIKCYTQQSTGVKDQQFVCLIQDNFLACIRTNQSSKDIRHDAVLTEIIR